MQEASLEVEVLLCISKISSRLLCYLGSLNVAHPFGAKGGVDMLLDEIVDKTKSVTGRMLRCDNRRFLYDGRVKNSRGAVKHYGFPAICMSRRYNPFYLSQSVRMISIGRIISNTASTENLFPHRRRLQQGASYASSSRLSVGSTHQPSHPPRNRPIDLRRYSIEPCLLIHLS